MYPHLRPLQPPLGKTQIEVEHSMRGTYIKLRTESTSAFLDLHRSDVPVMISWQDLSRFILWGHPYRHCLQPDGI